MKVEIPEKNPLLQQLIGDEIVRFILEHRQEIVTRAHDKYRELQEKKRQESEGEKKP